MAGITDAQHGEYAPAQGTVIITRVACPVPNRAPNAPALSGMIEVNLAQDSRIGRIAGREQIDEAYTCNYELAPAFQTALTAKGLRITGTDATGTVRAIELPEHRFFIATLYQPQLASQEGRPHPLITAFLEAAARYQADHGDTATY